MSRLRHTCLSSMRNGDLIRQMCQGESLAQRDRQSSLRGDHNEKVCRNRCYAVSRPRRPERRTKEHQDCRPLGLLSVLRPVLWVFQVYSRSKGPALFKNASNSVKLYSFTYVWNFKVPSRRSHTAQVMRFMGHGALVKSNPLIFK